MLLTKSIIFNKQQLISHFLLDEMVEIVTDFGGRVEKLVLNSRTTGVTRDVLLGHHGNSSSIVDNQYWRGMLLLPWANRIAYVSKYYICG